MKGRTLFLFAGAAALVATATRIDNREPRVRQVGDQPVEADVVASGPPIRIASGKRAYAIRVDDKGLASLLLPDCRVDIMVVTNDPERKTRVAHVLMENMRVLAIVIVPERAEDGRPMRAAVASIEVTPNEGERLATATAQGSLQLVLRGYGDADSVRIDSETVVIPERFKTPKPWVSPFQRNP